MEQLSFWITPTLVLGLFARRFMFRDLKENMNVRMSELETDATKWIANCGTT